MHLYSDKMASFVGVLRAVGARISGGEVLDDFTLIADAFGYGKVSRFEELATEDMFELCRTEDMFDLCRTE